MVAWIRQAGWLCCALVALGATYGCGGKRYVRDSEVAGLDDPAMSTGLDKRDLDKLLSECLSSLMADPVAHEWEARRDKARLAIYPIANETSEHVDGQLRALLSDIETYMVQSKLVSVISVEMQDQMIREVEKQHGGGFDPAHVADYNKQLGAELFVTGKVYDAAERTKEGRRVQYFLFLQLTSVPTSQVLWQHKSTLTKAYIDAH
ncbi:MAG: penicillin-binding protein activator LpoB [Polyangiaceae bacterium]|nr:penicillin-binding protein activator LpoB [Polyangiaceae bacterium]